MLAWLKEWAPLIAICVSIIALFGVPVWRWFFFKTVATHDDLRPIQNRLTAVEGDIALIKNDISHLPQRDDFDKLNASVSHVQADVSALRAQGNVTMATLGRISDHLLSQSK